MTLYKITAYHPALPYFHDCVSVHANEYNGTFYAVHKDLGCGKDYATEMAAVAELLHDHAYRITSITRI